MNRVFRGIGLLAMVGIAAVSFGDALSDVSANYKRMDQLCQKRADKKFGKFFKSILADNFKYVQRRGGILPLSQLIPAFEAELRQMRPPVVVRSKLTKFVMHGKIATLVCTTHEKFGYVDHGKKHIAEIIGRTQDTWSNDHGTWKLVRIKEMFEDSTVDGKSQGTAAVRAD